MGTGVQPVTIESLLRALGFFVDDRIARVLGTLTGAFYSTERPELYPPGKTKRRPARDAIRAVPGAICTGTGKATVWRVAAEAYEKHHARRAPVLHVVATSSDEDIAARSLESFRCTRAS